MTVTDETTPLAEYMLSHAQFAAKFGLAVADLPNRMFAFKSLGPNDYHYLAANASDGAGVGEIPGAPDNFSRWVVRPALVPGDSSSIFHFNLSSLGRSDKWLDGYTAEWRPNGGAIYISPRTDGIYTGTRWIFYSTPRSEEFGIFCGGHIPGYHWLMANNNRVVLFSKFEGSLRSLWSIEILPNSLAE